MNNRLSLLLVTTLALISASSSLTRAEDILWSLDFKNLAPDKPLLEVPYSVHCTGPQKVVTDPGNTLTGVASIDSLAPALQYEKNSTSHYTPSFTLKAIGAITTGIITVKFDLVFDRLTTSGTRPVETLMTFPLMNSTGSSNLIMVVACRGANELVLTGVGVAKSKTPFTFKLGEVAHIKAVLDLDKHTFQEFLNDTPVADPDHDDEKFTSFQGFTVRDGTALGGNQEGTSFTAGIANLIVSH